MASSARSTSHTLVHNVQAPGPALKNDLALLASLSVDSLRAFCETARAQLRGGAEQESAAATYRKAARQLGVEAGAVEAAVNALCYIIASAVAAGRGAEQLLDQDFELPALGAEAQDALRAFYAEVAPALQQELRSGLRLPRYAGLDWRLQVQLGGRYVARKSPTTNFLLRLRTREGEDGAVAEHLVQADLPNMRRLASELESALREDKSSHSRRIARRI